MMHFQMYLQVRFHQYDNDNEFIDEMYMCNNLYNKPLQVTVYVICTNWRELHSYK